jgi:hypothetical protein
LTKSFVVRVAWRHQTTLRIKSPLNRDKIAAVQLGVGKNGARTVGERREGMHRGEESGAAVPSIGERARF